MLTLADVKYSRSSWVSHSRKCGPVLLRDRLNWDNYVLIPTKVEAGRPLSERQSLANGTSLGTDLYCNCLPRSHWTTQSDSWQTVVTCDLNNQANLWEEADQTICLLAWLVLVKWQYNDTRLATQMVSSTIYSRKRWSIIRVTKEWH